MKKTKVDLLKVCQMLDNGWHVQLFRNKLGTYTAMARHNKEEVMDRLAKKNDGAPFPGMFVDEDGDCVTDDFTPEQALTRLAYKVHGEILGVKKS